VRGSASRPSEHKRFYEKWFISWTIEYVFECIYDGKVGRNKEIMEDKENESKGKETPEQERSYGLIPLDYVSSLSCSKGWPAGQIWPIPLSNRPVRMYSGCNKMY
jgi:hypothetical protein